MESLINARAVADADRGPRGRGDGDARGIADAPRAATETQLVRPERRKERKRPGEPAAGESRVKLNLQIVDLHTGSYAQPVVDLPGHGRRHVDVFDLGLAGIEHSGPQRIRYSLQPERRVHGEAEREGIGQAICSIE